MKLALRVATVLACGLLSGVAARASQPSGIFAHVTKVEFLPEGTNAENAKEIKIHGEFIMVEIDGDRSAVKAGFLHFSLPGEKKKDALCRSEWEDLAAIAGEKDEIIGKEDNPGAAAKPAGRYVAFGSANAPVNPDFSITRVHQPGATNTTAARYPVNAGLVRLRAYHRLEESKSPVLDFQKYRLKQPADKK